MQYLAIIAKVSNADNYIGWFADNFAGFASAKTRVEVEKKLPRLLASYFSEQPTRNPIAQSIEDVNPEYLEGSEEIQTLQITSVNFSPVSLEVSRAIKAAGINQSELAKRLGVSRAAVSKLVNPLNRSHQMETLQRVADALGMHLEPPRFTR